MVDREATATINDRKNTATLAFNLDLTCLPPIYVLATHLSNSELYEAEDMLRRRRAPLTPDIREANIVLGNVSRTRRARLELRWKGLQVEEVNTADSDEPHSILNIKSSTPAKKRRKATDSKSTAHAVNIVDDSTSAVETIDEAETDTKPMSQLSISELSSSHLVFSSPKKSDEAPSLPTFPCFSPNALIVIRLEWLTATVKADKLIPLEPFIILKAWRTPTEKQSASLSIQPSLFRGSILERAKADARPKPIYSRYRKRDYDGKGFSSSQVTRPIRLIHHETSEETELREGILPTMPDWVLQNKIYSCERSTPLNPPNSDFISLLKKIRLARELTLDQIGVRAYSTSIASISAYPYPLQTSREVLALPGCDTKIAHLFHEYHSTGQLQAILDIEADTALTCLRTFSEIWGVGATTARSFYFEKNWRDLDDIIEHGWKTLTRAQQIGLKYNDEFQMTLTRTQVEAIAATITRHAVLVTGPRIQTAIVGGYRRGKPDSGDVDIILSHPDESQTANLIPKIVSSLETEGWITHTLKLYLSNTKRNQNTLPLKTDTAPSRGFDTLDKALVVWQSPQWPPPSASSSDLKKAKNPNPHHRVDIIISPWRTVGCAIAGWTSGTTFQRDLRRYCKNVKGWKFDSSGVRERGGIGAWLDLEGYRDERTRCRTWEEAEKRVFRGLGLEWREPWERCTG